MEENRSEVRGASVAAFLAVALCCGIALVLRVWDLDRIGLNSDEAVYSGQAATLIGDPDLSRYFSPFRAHPLLLQTLTALVFLATGVSDIAARLLVALGFGLPSVVAAAYLARRMYGGAVGLMTLLVMAIVPYHVLLSRQVMLDVPLSLFLTLAVLALHRYSVTRDAKWWLMSAPLAGFAVMTKEVAILFVVVVLAFVLWARVRPRFTQVICWFVLFALTIAPFALTRTLFGSHTTGGYLLYQATRDPNHEWWYFPVVLWEFLTPALAILCGLGILLMIRRRADADKLLVSWILVFGLFFQVWPTKLFPYVIAILPALVIAGAEATRWLVTSLERRWHPSLATAVALLLGAGIVGPIVPVSAEVVRYGTEEIQGPFEADVEVQDFAGSREAAQWIGQHTPDGSVFLTIGPSVGNIISFYGHRDWYALSVSNDPRRRNPAYRPIPNPDSAIRTFQVHYAVWDHYSADRSIFYDRRLMRYVEKFNGTPVYSVWVDDGAVYSGRVAPEGAEKRVIVYDLTGGDPLEWSPDEETT